MLSPVSVSKGTMSEKYKTGTDNRTISKIAKESDAFGTFVLIGTAAG